MLISVIVYNWGFLLVLQNHLLLFFPHAQTKQKLVIVCQMNGYCYMSQVFLTVRRLLSNPHFPPEYLESTVSLLLLA